MVCSIPLSVTLSRYCLVNAPTALDQDALAVLCQQLSSRCKLLEAESAQHSQEVRLLHDYREQTDGLIANMQQEHGDEILHYKLVINSRDQPISELEDDLGDMSEKEKYSDLDYRNALEKVRDLEKQVVELKAKLVVFDYGFDMPASRGQGERTLWGCKVGRE